MNEYIYAILGVFLFIILCSIYIRVRDKKILETVTKSNRGTWAERDLVFKLLKHGIPSQNIFHDIYLRTFNSNFSQIDIVVITEVGIIVFEVKDYKGWIFGNGRQSQWTQVLAYGKRKYRFYNPIMQNNNHIKELRKHLRQPENIPFFSVVVFYGDCVLKDISFVPEGTFIMKSKRVLEVLNIIASNNKLVQYMNVNEVVNILKKAAQNGENKDMQMQHIENINDMLGKHRVFN